MFPSQTSAPGHLQSIQHLNARIDEAGGARFWFHALRNCFITVADRELKLPTSLTKRLVILRPCEGLRNGLSGVNHGTRQCLGRALEKRALRWLGAARRTPSTAQLGESHRMGDSTSAAESDGTGLRLNNVSRKWPRAHARARGSQAATHSPDERIPLTKTNQTDEG